MREHLYDTHGEFDGLSVARSGAAVTVNGRPAFRLGAYFFGGDDFDNSESGGFADLVAYAAKAQADDDGGDAEDLVSCVTGRVYVARSEESFEYDADGNQTLVTTATGRWRVEYDGENRPVRWTREGDGKVVAMSYDHLGRRRTKDGQRFYYDGYLQVANERTVSNEVVRESFVWDPTEPVATRPLSWADASGALRLYAHDWNKNVSEVVSAASVTNAAAEVLAHYDYAAFGAVVAKSGGCAEANPWRFSSECADTDLGLVYYNYRHYDPLSGRWLTRDPLEELASVYLYRFCHNPLGETDWLGLDSSCERIDNFNILSMNLSLTPLERAFNHDDTMNDAERFLAELAKLGLGSAFRIGNVNGVLRFILNRGASFCLKPGSRVGIKDEDLEGYLKDRVYKVEGTLKYQLCECANGKLRYRTQRDLVYSEEVNFSEAHDLTLYREAITTTLKAVEQKLINELYLRVSKAQAGSQDEQ